MSGQTIKEEALEFFNICGKQCGKTIVIREKITRVKDNYDRHFTTSSNFDFELDSFGVRMSGAKAMFLGKKFSYEISVGELISIEKKNEEYCLVENYNNAAYRLSIIKFI